MNELRAEAARLRAHLGFKAGERLLLRFRDRQRLERLERGWVRLLCHRMDPSLRHAGSRS